MAKANQTAGPTETAKTTTQTTTAKSKGKNKDLCNWRYIGFDGGRFVFELRSNKRVVTFDKPASLPPGNPSNFRVLGTAHGFHVNDQVIALCKK